MKNVISVRCFVALEQLTLKFVGAVVASNCAFSMPNEYQGESVIWCALPFVGTAPTDAMARGWLWTGIREWGGNLQHNAEIYKAMNRGLPNGTLMVPPLGKTIHPASLTSVRQGIGPNNIGGAYYGK